MNSSSSHDLFTLSLHFYAFMHSLTLLAMPLLTQWLSLAVGSGNKIKSRLESFKYCDDTMNMGMMIGKMAASLLGNRNWKIVMQ